MESASLPELSNAPDAVGCPAVSVHAMWCRWQVSLDWHEEGPDGEERQFTLPLGGAGADSASTLTVKVKIEHQDVDDTDFNEARGGRERQAGLAAEAGSEDSLAWRFARMRPAHSSALAVHGEHWKPPRPAPAVE